MEPFRLKKLIGLFTMLCMGLFSHAQLTVNGGQTPQQLASLLTGGGVTVSNVTMNCPNVAAGAFDGTNTNLNIGNGVLLTSGSIANAALPQTSPGITQGSGAAGDADLDILAGVPTFDACALEFDLVATCDTISIAYVFASDEYDEYVCASVNDAFGFFITGPGLNNQNIALIPGTNTPVSINSVNIGSPGVNSFPPYGFGCDTTNSAFFTTNNFGNTHEYDGQTVRLEAITWVQPCSTYHVKLVVADGGDDILDSGVFLEAGGIQCIGNDLEITTAFTNGSNFMVEGCTDADLYFVRDGNLSTALTIHFLIGGSAINGTDYTPLADSIVFPAGQDSVLIHLTAPDDGLTEGLETILIIIEDSSCGSLYSDTAEVFIVDPPVADFMYTSACPGFNAAFTDASFFPPGAITVWDWDFGDGGVSAIQNPNHIFVNPGVYTVNLRIETADGCMDSTSQTIEVFAQPGADFSSDGYCHGQTTDFLDLSVVGAGDTLQTWAWDFGDANSSVLQNPSHGYGSTGNFTVTLVVSNLNGCLDTISRVIDIHPLPQPEFSFSDVCDGLEVVFTDQTTIANGSISLLDWDLGDGNSQNLSQFNHTYAGPGTYTVHLIATSDQGCVDSVNHNVTIHPNPVADYEASFACLGDTSFFLDQSSLTAGTIQSWNWDFGDGNTSTDQNPLHVYSTAGVFAVSLTVVSDQGCEHMVSNPVNLPAGPPPPLTLHDTICTGFPANLYVIPQASGGVVNWYYSQNSTHPFHHGNSFSPGPLLNNTHFYVEFVSDEGCKSGYVPIFAQVNAPPNLVATFSDTEVEIPSAIVEFNANVTPSVVDQSWTFGDGNVSGSPTPVHQYAEPGQYDISLWYVDENGCENVYNWPLHITVTDNVFVLAPNAFSPNEDGRNDNYQVATRLITSFNIVIFDRWGNLLYESNDMSFRWDGGFKGQPLPEGVYPYSIKAIDFLGRRVEKQGTITLIR